MKNNKFLLCLTICLMFCFLQNTSFSQKETYNWYFGDSAGVSFMPDGEFPYALTDSKMKQMEGVATISDKNGNLLFYSDGVFVWNKKHNFISYGGGLKGEYSSSRSAIIIPKPRSNRYYYIFTIDSFERSLGNKADTNGLRYSVIDVLGDGGNGAVLPDKYNVPLLNSAVEKMITVNHSNQLDVWLIVYNRKDNSFYTYLIDKDGINAPNIQKRNALDSISLIDAVFNLDYDIKHNKLINCSRDNFSFEIYNFDNATGQIDIKNVMILPSYNFNAEDANSIDSTQFFIPYSAIFSEDGSKFYGSCYRKSILQYDLTLGDVSSIIASRFVVADSTWGDGSFGAIRRAPDNKIYVSCDTSLYLAVINYPNQLGDNCEFIKQGVFLEGKRCRLGLPIMMDYSVPPCNFSGYAGEDKTICSNESVMLGDLADTTGLDFEWFPKDYLDNPYSLNPICNAPQTITYVLKVTDRNIDCFDFDTVNIKVVNAPEIHKAGNFSTCKNNPVEIGNVNNNDEYTYSWEPERYLDNPNSKSPICTPEANITYILTVTNETGCNSYDTVKVTLEKLSDVKIVGDKYICENDSTQLTIEGKIISCKWNTGETTSSIIVKKAGTYIAEVVDEKGCVGDVFFEVNYFDKSAVKLVAPKAICEGTSVILKTSENFNSYLWNTGETTPSIEIYTSGTYWVSVTNEKGCVASDTALILKKEIKYNATKNIQLATCFDENVNKDVTLFNESDEAMLIESIKFFDNETKFLLPTNLLEQLPIEINKSEELSFNVVFQAGKEGIFFDTLLLEVSQPCYSIIKNPLEATSYMNKIEITSSDFTKKPGEEIKIPINILLKSNFPQDTKGNLTFDYTYNSTILKINTAENCNIISRNINDDLETITISTDLEQNLSKPILLHGNTFLGNNSNTELKVDNLNSNINCLEYNNCLNTLFLNACAVDLRTIRIVETTNLKVENTSNKKLLLSAKTQETGTLKIQLIDIIGRILFEEIWQKESNNFESKEFEINLSELKSGVYLVILHTSNCTISRKVMFIN